MENNVVSVMLWGEEVGKLYWVEITLGITNPPSGRIVKRLLADAVTKGMIEVL